MNTSSKETGSADASKLEWEEPRILDVGSLPEALGHCRGGSTQSPLLCHNGEVTSSEGGTGHGCANGGVAGIPDGGCVAGGEVREGGD